jgi:hypothetical protein
VYAVVAEQCGTLYDLLVGEGAGNDGPQTELLPLAGLLHQFASSDAPDTAEAVKDHILRLNGVLVLSDEPLQMVLKEIRGRSFFGSYELVCQLADIDLAWREVEVPSSSLATSAVV